MTGETMGKAPAGLVQKRQGYATEPLRKTVLFFTPLRTIQILGFILILVLSISFSGSQAFRSFDNHFYDQFLKYQPAPRMDPAVVYIGIEPQASSSLIFLNLNQPRIAIMSPIKQWGIIL